MFDFIRDLLGVDDTRDALWKMLPPEDRSFRFSAYPRDAAVPVVYGTGRVQGKVIWAAPEFEFKAVSYKDSNLVYGVPVIPAVIAIAEGPVTVTKYFRDGKEVPFNTGTTDAKPLCGRNYGTDVSEVRTGTASQAAIPSLHSSGPPAQPSYGYVSYFYSSTLICENKSLPDVGFEVVGFCATLPNGQAHPADVITDLLTNTRYGAGLPASAVDVDHGPDGQTSTGYRAYCDAMGFTVSGVLESTGSAIDFLKNLLDSTNSAAVWSDGTLRIVPLAEANLPAAVALGVDDFIVPSPDEEPITVTRRPSEECRNIHPVRYRSSSFNYEERTAEASALDSVQVEGPKRAQDFQSVWITSDQVARNLAQLRAVRDSSVRNVLTFRLGWRHAALEPGDLVALTEPGLGISGMVCRIRSIEEDDQGTLTVEAEERPTGVANVITMEPQGADGLNTPPPYYVASVAEAALKVAASTVIPMKLWDFGPTDAGWTLTNLTGASVEASTARRYTVTTTGGYLSVTGLNLLPAESHGIAIRFRVVSGGSWEGALAYSNSNHSFSDSYSETFSFAPGEWTVRVLDLRTSGDFLSGGNITGFRFKLMSDTGSVVDLDWVQVGRFGTLSADLSNVIPGSVSADLLANGAVSAAKLADGSVSAAKLVAGAVGSDALATSAVVADKIAAGVIGTDHLVANAITAGKIAAGAMATSNYAEDGSGNPTTGAKLDHEGTALKVAAGNLQIGTKLLSEADIDIFNFGSANHGFTRSNGNGSYTNSGGIGVWPLASDFTGAQGMARDSYVVQGVVTTGSTACSLKVTAAGTYLISYRLSGRCTTSATDLTTKIKKNGSYLESTYVVSTLPAANAFVHHGDMVSLALAANDQIEVGIYVSPSLTIQVSDLSLFIQRLA
jgi:hypothetical protein